MAYDGTRLLQQAALTAIRSTTVLQLGKEVCELIAGELELPLVWIGEEDNQERGIRLIGSAGPAVDYLSQLTIPHQGNTEGRETPSVAARGQVSYYALDQSDDQHAATWKSRSAAYGISSHLSVPLKLAPSHLAVMNAYAKNEGYFDAEKKALLKGLAEILALGWSSVLQMEEVSERSKSLRLRNRLYQKIAESSPLGVMVIEQSSRVVSVNPAMLDLLHRSWEEVVGRQIDDLFDTNSTLRIADVVKASLSPADERQSPLLSFTTKGGETKWVRVSFGSTDEDNSDCEYIVFAQDATAWLHDKQELERTQTLLRLGASHAPVMIFGLDEQDRILFNEGGLSFPGGERLKVGDKPALAYSSDLPKAEGIQQDIRQGGKLNELIVNRNGRVLKFWSSALEAKSSGSPVSGGVAIDITELERDRHDLMNRVSINQLLANYSKWAMTATHKSELISHLDTSLAVWRPTLRRVYIGDFGKPGTYLEPKFDGAKVVRAKSAAIVDAGFSFEAKGALALPHLERMQRSSKLADALAWSFQPDYVASYIPIPAANEAPIILVLGDLASSIDNRDLAMLLDSVSAILNASLQRLVANENLQRLSRTDLEMGLPNLRALDERLAQSSGEEAGITAILITLSRDRLFERYSRELVRHLRVKFNLSVIDRVRALLGPEAEPYYPKDGELLIVLGKASGPSEAVEIASRVEAVLAEPFEIGGLSVYLPMGVRVFNLSSFDLGSQTLREYIDSVPELPNGPLNNTRSLGARSSSEPHSQTTIARALTKAIENGTLRLHYQPQIDTSSRQVVGAEALLRWQDSVLGPIGPDVFIPLAERIGLIHPITEFVIKEATAAAARIANLISPFPIAINISPKSLNSSALMQLLLRELELQRIPPSLIQIELTETAAFRNAEMVALRLNELASTGFLIGIDDFGTGYTSIMHLNSMSVNHLKVDKSFVLRMLENPTSLAIVRSVIDLGRMLGIEVIAEGVETLGHVKMLEELGCPTLQGFVFAKAMPEDELMQWLQNPVRIELDEPAG